jgi:hypothetical protein
MAKKYFKLNQEKGNIFFDPSQPETKKLVGDHIAALEETKRVLEWKRNDGLQSSDEKEYNAWLESKKAKMEVAAATSPADAKPAADANVAAEDKEYQEYLAAKKAAAAKEPVAAKEAGKEDDKTKAAAK